MINDAVIQVSVVLPVYNAAASLPQAIDSILAQEFDGFELIVVDDGSTDGPQQIDHPSVRWIRTEHGGLVAALNRGIAESRGSYIARMDADDLAYPDRLRLQAQYLDERPDIGLVASRVEYLGDRQANQGLALFVDWTNTLLDHDSIAVNRFVESPLVHPSVMFRRDLVDRFGGYRAGDFPEDYELWLRWLEAGVRMEKLPETLLGWRDRPDRLTRTDPRYSVDAFFAAKAPYLMRELERRNPRHPQTTLWGAGRTTRLRLRPLFDLGLQVGAWVDIDPRKIGQRINGVEVIGPDALSGRGETFVLAAVGSRGARELIAGRLEERGYRLGQDWLACA